jgi:hypothetical protein
MFCGSYDKARRESMQGWWHLCIQQADLRIMRFLFLHSMLAAGVSATDFVTSFSALESASPVESEMPSISLVHEDMPALKDIASP